MDNIANDFVIKLTARWLQAAHTIEEKRAILSDIFPGFDSVHRYSPQKTFVKGCVQADAWRAMLASGMRLQDMADIADMHISMASRRLKKIGYAKSGFRQVVKLDFDHAALERAMAGCEKAADAEKILGIYFPGWNTPNKKNKTIRNQALRAVHTKEWPLTDVAALFKISPDHVQKLCRFLGLATPKKYPASAAFAMPPAPAPQHLHH